MIWEIPPWKRVIVENLEKRDRREKYLYAEIIERNTKLEAQIEPLRAEVSLLKLQYEAIIAQTKIENNNGSNENSAVQQEINKSTAFLLVTLQNKQQQSHIAELQQENDSLKAKVNELKSTIVGLKEEEAAAKRLSEHYQNELMQYLSLRANSTSTNDVHNKIVANHSTKLSGRNIFDLLKKFAKSTSSKNTPSPGSSTNEQEAKNQNGIDADIDAFEIIEVADEAQPTRSMVRNNSICSSLMSSRMSFYDSTSSKTFNNTCSFDTTDRQVNAVKFSENESYLCTAGSEGRLKMWNVQSCTVPSERAVQKPDNIDGQITSLDVSGDFMVTGWSNGIVHCWKLACNNVCTQHTHISHGTKKVSAVSIYPRYSSGNRLASASHDRRICVRDLIRNEWLNTFNSCSMCNDVQWCGQSVLVSAHPDKKVRIWDLRTWSKQTEICNLNGRVASVDIDPAGENVLACIYAHESTDESCVQWIDLRNMNTPKQTFASEDLSISIDSARARLSCDGSKFAVGSADGALFVWDVRQNSYVRYTKTKTHEYGKHIAGCSWNYTDNCVATCDKTNTVTLWAV